MGGAGINAVSLAQSRWVGMGVEHGGTRLNGSSTRGGGSKMGAGGVLDMLVAAKDMGGGETDHLWGIWGKLGGWDMARGHSGV